MRSLNVGNMLVYLQEGIVRTQNIKKAYLQPEDADRGHF